MYRFAQAADKAAIMKLWAVDFESYEPYYSWYFNNIYRPERTLCDFEGEQLAAALQFAPYTLALGGAALKICYMVGVITDPAMRKQGRGHALLRYAHDYLQQQGYDAALLYTDIPGFYAPLGYRHCYRQQTLRITAGAVALTKTGGPESPPLQARSLLREIPALSEIYGKMTARYEGYIRRTEENWRNYLGEQACDNARLLLAEGQAYALYTVDKEKLHVVELGFADEAALAAVLTGLALQARGANVPALLWHGPDDAPLLLPQIPASDWQERPFVMALPLNGRGAELLKPGERILWINEYT